MSHGRAILSFQQTQDERAQNKVKIQMNEIKIIKSIKQLKSYQIEAFKQKVVGTDSQRELPLRWRAIRGSPYSLTTSSIYDFKSQ